MRPEVVLGTPGNGAGSTLAAGRAHGGCIGAMRYESSVTSLSWIPSEAVERAAPDRVRLRASPTTTSRRPTELEDIEALRAADRFRFANRLRAWIEVDEAGRITAAATAAAA